MLPSPMKYNVKLFVQDALDLRNFANCLAVNQKTAKEVFFQ